MINFNPFWKMCKEKNISTYKLEHTYNINRAMISKLKHDKNINLATLNDLCNTFECDIHDIIEYVKD